MVIRKYQKECINVLKSEKLGRIVLPTATGKTTIALEFIAHRIKQGGRLFVVFVPRIMLGKQWIRKTSEVLLRRYRQKINFVNINTGGISRPIRQEFEKWLFEYKFPVKPIVSSTNPEAVRAAVEFCRKDDSAVIVICTYHSCEVLLGAGLDVDTMFADECHFIVSDNEFFRCTELAAKRKFYMTATPRFTDADSGASAKGMQNEEVYGPIIYEKKPVEMIEVGAIVAPLIHVVATNQDTNTSSYNSIMRLIYESFLKHRERLKKNSAKPEECGAKLLIICDGQLTLQGLFACREFRDIRAQDPNLKFFGLCTEYGVMIDGQHFRAPVNNSRKEELLLALTNLKSSDDAILMHVDMIGEGLDVPAISGIFMLRNTGKIKFLQNEGRAGRLHPLDVARLEDGSLKLKDYGNYIKPNCYVILPYCLPNKDDFVERSVKLIQALREDFDFDPSEHVIIDILHPAQKGPDFDEDKLEREIRGQVGMLFSEICHTIEDKYMSEEELLIMIKVNQLDELEKQRLIGLLGGGIVGNRKKMVKQLKRASRR